MKPLWDQGEWTPREKKLAVSLGIVVLLLIGGTIMVWTGEEEKPASVQVKEYSSRPKEATPKKKEKEKKADEWVVDIKGSVKHPGVYRFSPGARVQEAVQKAGGPEKQADLDRVNLAAPLSDGMALYIPAKGEDMPSSMNIEGSQTSSARASNGTIKLNTASAEELQELNGIGPSKAEAIISYREENGPFTSVEQLTEVPGIGEKTLDQLRDQIAVQ